MNRSTVSTYLEAGFYVEVVVVNLGYLMRELIARYNIDLLDLRLEIAWQHFRPSTQMYWSNILNCHICNEVMRASLLSCLFVYSNRWWNRPLRPNSRHPNVDRTGFMEICETNLG